jgi:uncharacterized Zn-finger protein
VVAEVVSAGGSKVSEINKFCIGEKHTVVWSDGGSVGYVCPKDPASSYGDPTGSLDAEDRDEARCEYCGVKLKLIYDVHIEEVV